MPWKPGQYGRQLNNDVYQKTVSSFNALGIVSFITGRTPILLKQVSKYLTPFKNYKHAATGNGFLLHTKPLSTKLSTFTEFKNPKRFINTDWEARVTEALGSKREVITQQLLEAVTKSGYKNAVFTELPSNLLSEKSKLLKKGRFLLEFFQDGVTFVVHDTEKTTDQNALKTESEGLLAKVAEDFKNNPDITPVLTVKYTKQFAHLYLTHPKINKGTVAEFIAGTEGDTKSWFSTGDAENDIPMLARESLGCSPNYSTIIANPDDETAKLLLEMVKASNPNAIIANTPTEGIDHWLPFLKE